MNALRRGWSKANLAWAALWSALSALVLLQSSPWVVQTPANDNGIFLYFGQQILRGKLPFVDLWDHKPPLVFYLDALGLLLGGGSRWGVWLVEVLSLAVACLCGFFFLRRYFRAWPAFIAVAGMLANLAFILEGGNLTEEFALSFQFAALFIFAWEEESPRAGWKGLLIGALMAGACLLKQTLVGVWLAMGVYLLASLLFTRRKRAWTVLWQMAAGFAAVMLASFAYFALRGALGPYWDVAFAFNFLYSSVSTPERVGSLLDVLHFLNTQSGFFLLGAAAWLFALPFVLLHHEAALWQVTRRWVGLAPLAGGLFLLYDGPFSSGLRLYALSALSLYRWGLIAAGLVLAALSLVFFSGLAARRIYPWIKSYQVTSDTALLLPVYLGLIDLPVELVMVSVSGRGYRHYYLSLFPALVLLVAFLVGTIYQLVQRSSDSEKGRKAVPALLTAALLLPVLYGGAAQTAAKIRPGSDLQTTLTVRYIRENTRPGDKVLMWGTQTGIYFLSGRESPTRYVHQIPLITPGYVNQQRAGEFLGDLEREKPALIIDTRLASIPLPHNPGDANTCAKTDRPHVAEMEPVYQFICQNYTPVEQIGPDSWLIYRYNPTTPAVGQKP